MATTRRIAASIQIDTTFSYDNAILALPDGSVISGKIESWKDYDDGDQALS